MIPSLFFPPPEPRPDDPHIHWPSSSSIPFCLCSVLTCPGLFSSMLRLLQQIPYLVTFLPTCPLQPNSWQGSQIAQNCLESFLKMELFYQIRPSVVWPRNSSELLQTSSGDRCSLSAGLELRTTADHSQRNLPEILAQK